MTPLDRMSDEQLKQIRAIAEDQSGGAMNCAARTFAALVEIVVKNEIARRKEKA